MDFSDNKPIPKQIEDYCRQQIMSGSWLPESRVPSTKELALKLGVNPRTVMKAYDVLAEEGIIHQRRGMGYFISPDAPQLILEKRRLDFFNIILPEFGHLIEELQLSIPDVLAALTKITAKNQKTKV